MASPLGGGATLAPHPPPSVPAGDVDGREQVTAGGDLHSGRLWHRSCAGALDRTAVGCLPGVNLVLLAAPAAQGYYPRVGFEQHRSAWLRRPVREWKRA